MEHKGILSSAFNMSWGFLPLVISMLLCEWMAQDTATYIGTSIAIAWVGVNIHRKGINVPNFILHISTIVLLLITCVTFLPEEYLPPTTLPLTIEIFILIPMLMIFLHRKRFIRHFLRQIDSCKKRLFAQGAECSTVAARIALLFGGIHLVVACIVFSVRSSVSPEVIVLLYKVFPPAVFILTILCNQIAIRYFNRLMSHTEYVPIVNTRGDVIGKSLTIEAANYKNTYINPVIRIAVSVQGMLYLCKRPTTSLLDEGKVDHPMECYLRYGETLSEGAERLLSNTLPQIPKHIHPEFNIIYHFENEVTNRLIYLFIAEIDDDSILRNLPVKGGKLWHFTQIEENLNKGFFSSCLEEEFEHLKEVIYIREKYKES